MENSDRRLLILDDEPAVGELIRRIAKGAGVEARTTTSAATFFRELETWDPTHIALDLNMPEMDGVEVLGRLAEMGCRASLILTSGVGSRVLDAAGRSAAEHGLDLAGILPKPFSAADLRRLLGVESERRAHPAESAGGRRPATAGREPALSADDLAEALREHRFFLAFQPKVECSGGRLAGFEALVRLRSKNRRAIPPGRFIPLAETSGFIDELTDEILDLALSWLAREGARAAGKADRLPPLTLAVNLSARSLSDAGFVERVIDRCRHHEVDPSHVVFELTETSAMEDPHASLDRLTRLRVKGFQLAIDDFGTGYSSMLQLVRLPFSEIKIDRSFVLTLTESAESRAVCRSIVDLGHSLGLRAVAEGVEDRPTLELLREIGCDLAQGYFIARPMEAEAAARWLAERQASPST